MESHAFYIGQKKIVLRNVPYFYCAYCEKALFGPGIDPTPVLKYAYLHDMDEVDWEKRNQYK